jgi:hypothetical protein
VDLIRKMPRKSNLVTSLISLFQHFI